MTDAPAGAAQPAPAGPQFTPEQLKQRADHSRAMMAAFGSIVAVYMRSPHHRELRLVDIEPIIAPAVSTGQFTLVEATNNQNGFIAPVACVLWASVSADVDQRIAANPEQPLQLAMPEWKGGENIWVVEAVGNQEMLGKMLQRLKETAWKGRVAKMRAVGEGGRIVVQAL